MTAPAPLLRLDVISIFPDYFSPLSLSLVGKAIASGVVGLGVHDLRDWTHDRHRTVDDTPYGGGAGMVMKPEPWGEALDDVIGEDAEATTLVVPTPSGIPYSQAIAAELSTRRRLVFACGRYEGIDARVMAHFRDRVAMKELSLGDYVLNGGEVAALAIIESVVRLVPGVIGNPESLVEESHSPELDGLLEYPVYTKPIEWRGLAVPEVLLSGHHARIAQWRRDRALDVTLQRRAEAL